MFPVLSDLSTDQNSDPSARYDPFFFQTIIVVYLCSFVVLYFLCAVQFVEQGGHWTEVALRPEQPM